MHIRDSYDEFVAHDARKESRLKERPVCCSCGEPIQEEFAYQLNGDWYCEDCEDVFIDVIRREYRERVM